MDQNDPIPEMYYLDASPGAERPLKRKRLSKCDRATYICILYAPIEGDKEWLGILKSVDDDTITMEVKEKQRKQLRYQEIKLQSTSRCNDLT